MGWPGPRLDLELASDASVAAIGGEINSHSCRRLLALIVASFAGGENIPSTYTLSHCAARAAKAYYETPQSAPAGEIVKVLVVPTRSLHLGARRNVAGLVRDARQIDILDPDPSDSGAP